MTIKECIDIVDNVKPNQYSIREKVMWLSFVDETIINDVLKTHEGYDGRYDNFEGYTEDKLSVPLIVPSPYDRLYTAYLKMKIDSENGETARYNNSAALYNTYLTEYKKYYNKTHMPIGLGGMGKKSIKKDTARLSDAEYENIKRELYYLLLRNVNEVISHDKLYDIVTEYVKNNIEMLKGKGGIKNLRDGSAEKAIEGADSEENPAISLGESCISIGDGCISGCMGYYIQAIDFTNKKIYLTDAKVDGLPTVGAGEVTDLDVPYVYNVTAEPVYFSITNGNHYILCGTIKSIENNVVTYNEDNLGFNGFVSDTGIDGHTFHVPTQPTVGVVSFITNAVSIGSGIINVGKCTFSAGRDNILLSDYGVNIGRGNTTGYGAFSSGRDNYIPAQFGLGLGNKNKVTGYAGIGLGIANEIIGDYSVGIGDHLKVYGLHQFVRGLYNIPDYENKYLDIVGNGFGGENARSNAYTLDRNGNARFKGKVYAECEDGIGVGKELATKESVDKLNKSKGMVFKDIWKENTLPSTMLDEKTPNYEVVGNTYKLEVESAINGYAHRLAAGVSVKIFESNQNYLVTSEMRSNYLAEDLAEFTRLLKILGIVDMDFQLTGQDVVISCNRFVGFHKTTNQTTGAGFTGEEYTANITTVEYIAETNTIGFKGTWIEAPPAYRNYNHPLVAYSTDNIYNAYSPYVGYYKPLAKVLNTFPKDKMVTYSLNCGWVDF